MLPAYLLVREAFVRPLCRCFLAVALLPEFILLFPERLVYGRFLLPPVFAHDGCFVGRSWEEAEEGLRTRGARSGAAPAPRPLRKMHVLNVSNYFGNNKRRDSYYLYPYHGIVC